VDPCNTYPLNPVPLAAPPEPKGPSGTFYQRVGKRAVGSVLAVGVLIVTAPIMAAVALAVRLSMGPGVIYSQTRVGQHQKPFQVLKFRSMSSDRRDPGGAHHSFPGDDRRMTHKTTADPRHTRLGRFLRKTSLDELPQLINVLRGEMCLVGPRPELVDVAQQRGYLDHCRHTVRPGITGEWQTSPDRSGFIWQNLHHDAAYVTNVTLRNDVRLLARTPWALIRNAGA